MLMNGIHKQSTIANLYKSFPIGKTDMVKEENKNWLLYEWKGDYL